MQTTYTRREALNALLLAAVYVIAARIGLLFEPVGGFASLVWAPSGIALAALILHGNRLWPGVLVGAAAANALVGASFPLALIIGAGNSLGAVVAAAALRRLSFDAELHDTRSAIQLVAVSLCGAAISATVGAVALDTAGITAGVTALEVWRAWWTGDAIGNLLVAPLLLVWGTHRPHGVPAARRTEFLVVLLVNVAVSAAIFSDALTDRFRPAAYLLFPFLIWAAMRFETRGAVTAMAAAAAAAIFGTVEQRGPFAHEQLHLGLFGLQTFVGVMATTFLVLGSAIAERRVAELRARRSREHAEEANRAKADFLAVMSHELRTPLNAIGGFVDLLLAEAQGGVNDRQRNSLERIQRNHYHLLALINDLLAFTRIEAGKVVLDIRVVSVSSALDDVEPLVKPEMRRKQIAFTRNGVDGELAVRADRDKLTQILVNLLSNAAKYTEAGGTISVGADDGSARVRLWVRDTGIGIPADQLDKVFEPFFQVDRGRTRRYEGVGLGLTIARDLARAMGGDVWVANPAGGGTEVSVHLPRA